MTSTLFTPAKSTSKTPLAVEELHRIFVDNDAEVHAVDGVTFTVEDGEFYTLLGPSGCGKTTTLRCVAGLERTNGGQVIVDGRVVSSDDRRQFVPPHRRDIGMVFQSYGIWPHLTVFENTAFPLRRQRPRLSKAEIHERASEALNVVQLPGYEGRMATALSGGQQQRLALARALVRRPKLLLLDEPLSNLDARLREAMRAELSGLQRRTGLTTLYVTHDQAEALSMSTRIAVMSAGKIVQEAAPREIYSRPASKFVAEFVGTTNFISGSVRSTASDGMIEVSTDVGPIHVAREAPATTGAEVLISFRPETIEVSRESVAGRPNQLQGRLDQVMFLGELLECHVVVGERRLIARLPPESLLNTGDDVWVHVPPKAVAAFHVD